MRGKRIVLPRDGVARRITPADAGKTLVHNHPQRRNRDHPRGCGENENADLSGLVGTGSPPRMRGKHTAVAVCRGNSGITPADAGKTGFGGGFGGGGSDHPRGCGENFTPASTSMYTRGSPPRMRGKLLLLRFYVPASRDHPRGCGENSCLFPPAYLPDGSPPRMRGKRSKSILHPFTSWITPADAGKTTRIGFRQYRATDHPRGCGENISKDLQVLHKPGSPPRMRGKRFAICDLFSPLRITPADAGKTFLPLGRSRIFQDHPRGCGENASM